MNGHQQEIKHILLKNNKIMTLEQIGEEASFGYYHNGNKHLGAVLSRMVKNGTIIRVNKGKFRIRRESDIKKRKYECWFI